MVWGGGGEGLRKFLSFSISLLFKEKKTFFSILFFFLDIYLGVVFHCRSSLSDSQAPQAASLFLSLSLSLFLFIIIILIPSFLSFISLVPILFFSSFFLFLFLQFFFFFKTKGNVLLLLKECHLHGITIYRLKILI